MTLESLLISIDNCCQFWNWFDCYSKISHHSKHEQNQRNDWL